MNETVRVVPTNAALAGQQSFGISGQCVNRNTSDPDVSRFAIKVLAVLGCFLLPCVVAGGAESTIDIHRLTEVIPDFLQQGHKLVVDKDRVAAVLTLKLPDVKVLAQSFAPVLCIGIAFGSKLMCDLQIFDKA